MDRSNLVQAAIKEAYKKNESNTVITEHEGGVNTVTTFYKKNKAIWCRMVTGCIDTKSRVYKVDTEPYIRDMGRYWKITGEELEIVKRLAREA